MLAALLNGKLSRDQENMEDILTSNVFGAFKYSADASAVLRFLSKAVLPNSITGRDSALAHLSSAKGAELKFWPWLMEPGCAGCEPDVLLRIDSGGQTKYLVAIEAKYRSGKSSEADHKVDAGDPEAQGLKDQLAREWRQIKSVAKKEGREPFLIYLTADFSCPIVEIEASQKELLSGTGSEGRICWLSWRHLSTVLQECDKGILSDLLAVLRRLDLTFFEGFSRFELRPEPQWTFSFKFSWNWLLEPKPMRWDFKS